MNEKLDEVSFTLYAAKHYNSAGSLDTDEFFNDLKRFKYLKRLFNKYEENGELKERLILNHIIIIYNVFGVTPATRMLFFRLEEHMRYLEPFLEFLGYLPKEVKNIGFFAKDINCYDIMGDDNIKKALQEL